MYGTSEKVALLRWLLCLLITGGACAMSCQDESTDVFLGILQAQMHESWVQNQHGME
jgi:hypothetical protein